MLFESFKGFVKYRENPNTVFFYNGAVYALNKVLEILDKRKPHLVNISDLEWVLSFSEVNNVKLSNADYTKPIIYTKNSAGKLVVLDGKHRLRKAKRDGMIEIAGELISQRELNKCKIGV